MAQTVGEFLVERLQVWGIKRVFGYPGDGINGILSAFQSAEDKISFIQARHEEMAAFMACGHAKYTGEPGVCLATSGPGAIHLLNGLYDAKLDHQPVVAIVGQQKRMSMGGDFQQEVDLLSLFKDVAGAYVQVCNEPSQIRHLADRAFRIAMAERTVTCIIIPNDVQEMEYKDPPVVHGAIFSSPGYTASAMVPAHDQLQQAAAILNEGKKVAILIGAGAMGAAAEVMQVAELLGAGVAKALLGKAVLPDDLPYVTGAIGLLGTGPSWELMNDCDTLLMIGSSFPYAEFLPEPGQAKAVQIDVDGKMLGIRYPMDVMLQGHAKQTLHALIPLLQRKDDRNWRQQIEKSVRNWHETIEKRAMQSADPVNPQLVFHELNKRLPHDCILAADSGSTTFWYARNLQIRQGMKASVTGSLATMCSSVPYAIAAKFAHPDKIAIAISGDGAMQMLGMNELITVAKYYKQWSDPRMMVIVINNLDLNMVTWEQRALAGYPKFEASQEIPDVSFAAFARSLGLEGYRITRPEEVQSMLDAAFASDKPVVVEALCDANVPILPPHMTRKQITKFFTALMKGDSEANDIIKQVYKEVTA
ncbi:MAG TPA: thiamine pyrophosphate-requiring protein [Chitinophagaceae bacterium]|nr:thiamine pyrophosphate-requiring protein [Chitinophagaceae bacterium]